MSRVGTWPADRLYWAELDASVLPARHRADPERLGFLLESVLPVPLESVQAAYCRSGGRVVACAIDRDVLEAALRSPGSLAWTSLRPDGPPPPAAGVGVPVDGRRLNLLTGRYRPAVVRSRERQAWILAAAAAVAVTGVLSVGLQRRAAAAAAAADAVRSAARESLMTAVAPASVPPDASLPRLELAIESELAALRRTRGSGNAAGAAERSSPDASLALARVLAAWPDEPGVRVRTLESGGEVVRLDGLAPSPEAAERVRAAVDAIDGWRGRLPQVEQRQAALVQFTLVVEREHERAEVRP